jgi:hypothetical protein
MGYQATATAQLGCRIRRAVEVWACWHAARAAAAIFISTEASVVAAAALPATAAAWTKRALIACGDGAAVLNNNLVGLLQCAVVVGVLQCVPLPCWQANPKCMNPPLCNFVAVLDSHVMYALTDAGV